MWWNKHVVGIAVAAMMSAGLAGASSQAAAPPGNEWFAPCDSGTAAVSARGGFVREPDLGQTAEDLPASAKGKAGPNFHVTVPVYFHVITDGATGALTNAEISAQIDVLNTTYAGGEGGARTGFSFRLAGVTRTDNADWFSPTPNGNDENAMKRALHTGGPGDLNLYSVTSDTLLGWAYLPDIVTKPGRTYLDGVILNWESVPGASTAFAGRYDEGKTATHEVGHWLNLEHTFYGGCNAKGDFVDDTPAEKTPTSGCPAGKDTCTAPGDDPIHNYMDYSYDSCYNQFTPGQAQRMADAWTLYRA